MASNSRRKPLEDARKRVNEKLNAIEEQRDFIQSSVRQLIAGVRKTANDLLGETNKTKFFNKYRAVSLELEKCLDDLLLISATVSSLDDKDEEDESGDDDDEDEEGTHVSENEEGSKPDTPSKHMVCGDYATCRPANQMLSSPSIPPEQGEDKMETIVTQFQTPSVLTQSPQTAEESAHVAATEPFNVEPPDKYTASSVGESLSDEFKNNLSGSYDGETLEQVPPGKNKTRKSLDTKSFSTKSCKSKSVECSSLSKHFQRMESLEQNSPRSCPVKDGELDIKTQVVQKDFVMTPCSIKISSSLKLPPERIDFDKVRSDDEKQLLSELTVTADVVKKITSKDSSLPLKSVPRDKKAPSGEGKAGFPTEVIAGDIIEEALRAELIELPTARDSVKPRELQIPPFAFLDGQCLEVAVAEIVSPHEFWIQQTNSDLDLLMEDMCMFFSKRAKVGDKGGMAHLPVVGGVCCGKSSDDDVWYRALVTAVSCENDSVDVLYVDEGNKETLPLSRIRPIETKYLQLPCQALCCALSGVRLRREAKYKEVNDWFRRRVSGEILEAVLADKTADLSASTPVAIHLYIRPPGKTSSTAVDSLKQEYSIKEMMVREGISEPVASPESPRESNSTSPSSSPSDAQSLTKSESLRSSSTRTSGFDETQSCSSDQMPSPVQHPRAGCLDQLVAAAKVAGFQADISSCRVPPPVIHLDSDGSFCMLVSHVVNPGEFYIHCVTSDAGKLDTLMNDMNRIYEDPDAQNAQDSAGYSPRVGDFCSAKFSGDGNWYRALVLQVHFQLNGAADVVEDSDDKGRFRVVVFYIDFGNTESVGVESLRKLLPCFMELPMQVVRCSLAYVEPLGKCSDMPNEVFIDDPPELGALPDFECRRKTAVQHRRNRLSHSQRMRRRTSRRSPSNASSYENAIAGGDEDAENDLLDSFFLPDSRPEKVRSRSSILDDIEKSRRSPLLLADTAVLLFETVWSGVASETVGPSWSKDSTEHFKSLTNRDQKLVGFVEPWDSEMVNAVVNYSQGAECSLPNLGPVLTLNLYDVCGDEDVFINGAMVTANLAQSSAVVKEKTGANFGQTSSSERSVSSSSPKSPTSKLLETWDPMSTDYNSIRNAYNVQTDSVDVAITGYEWNRGNICPYYHTKYGCYRGSKCPKKHVEKDVSGLVTYGAKSSVSITLPDVGTWVLVRVTAVYSPDHFWVQLPFGTESLDSQIIKSRSGRQTSGEENLKDLKDLMDRMQESYSKMFRRERQLAPVGEGELVVVRYKKDNLWYRGKVIGEKGDYQVCFVDYGFSAWVDASDICPMMPHFLHLPFQAVECYMANIKSRGNTQWSKDSQRHFDTLVEDRLLVCQVFHRSFNDTMLVDLFDTEGQEKSICEEMIDSGYAEQTPVKTVFPPTRGIHQTSGTVVELPG